jgi:hypothetical protein
VNWSIVVSLIRTFLTGSKVLTSRFEAVNRRKKIEAIGNYLLIETPVNCDCIHIEQKCTHDVDISAIMLTLQAKMQTILNKVK